MRASQQMINWIDYFIEKKIAPIPEKESLIFRSLILQLKCTKKYVRKMRNPA